MAKQTQPRCIIEVHFRPRLGWLFGVEADSLKVRWLGLALMYVTYGVGSFPQVGMNIGYIDYTMCDSTKLVGGSKYFLMFIPTWGNDPI